MNTDRLAEGYEPQFDIDYEVGHQAELFVGSVIESLGGGRVEVKNDQLAKTTGNVYIEWSCLRRGAWHPSGISTTKADIWAFVLADSVVVFAPTAVVRQAARKAFREGRKGNCSRGSHPTQGVLVPVSQLLHRLFEAAP